MWGKVYLVKRCSQRLGITPTHVGKRSVYCFGMCFDKDHPHPCGEKCPAVNLARQDTGSPPPMWGKGSYCDASLYGGRITPTHVGKSITLAAGNIIHQDHPHPCGEKMQPWENLQLGKGSPPPMWGKAHFRSTHFPKNGITPTHVGKRRAYGLI